MIDPAIKSIGKIQSALKNIEDCPLQGAENAPEATIIISPEFIEGIKNLAAGQEVLLLTWLHMADRTIIKCYPRHNYDAPFMGVFLTRSPDRPNPIGIHPVKILSVSANGIIKVSGLEALDQTPVIDIKPVLKK
ncbi:MAG: tsaA [Mucilaginibacter sp.]|nr:tsaA [Mucilaginibacter sp.]